MQKIIFVLLVGLLLNTKLMAQLNQSNSFDNPPMGTSLKRAIGMPSQAMYFGISSGINNPYGLLGVDLEYAKAKFSVGLGAGISSWGTKMAIEGKYYTKTFMNGWAFGAAITHSTGGVYTDYKTVNTRQTVAVNLLPIQTLSLVAYHYWKISFKGSRFYLKTGLSNAFQQDKVSEVGNRNLLDTDDKRVLKIISPGGLILGLGFDFVL